MKVSFQLEYEDYEAFVLHYAKHSTSRGKIYRVTRWLLLGVMVLLAIIEFFRADFRPVLVVALACLGVAMFLIFPLMFDLALKSGARRMYSKSQGPDVFTAKVLELKPDGLLISTGGHTGITPWRQVLALEQNDAHIFLYITQNAAHIIPKRSFENEEAAKAFAAAAERYINNK